MDQIPNTPQPVQVMPQKQNKKLSVIILGILATLLLFIILFAVNYFHILHVYRFIPGFSYLPTYVPKVTPFPHDTQLGETTLGAFLQKNMKPAFLSTSSNKYFSAGTITEAGWLINKDNYQISFDSKLFPESSNNDVRYIRISASPTVLVDQTNLRNTLDSYFNVSLPPTLPCFNDTATHNKYCQQLTRVGNTRRIVGAQFALDKQGSPSAQTSLLYLCELYQNVADNQNVSCTNVH